jgi:hypothetical protein
MKTIEVSEDQNTVTVDGVKYEAVKSNLCVGCAFCGQDNTTTEECKHSPCMPQERKDGRNLIFKKSEQ